MHDSRKTYKHHCKNHMIQNHVQNKVCHTKAHNESRGGSVFVQAGTDEKQGMKFAWPEVMSLHANTMQELKCFDIPITQVHCYISTTYIHQCVYIVTKVTYIDLQDNEEIKAMNGKTVPLVDIFAHSLKYIRELAIKELRNNFDNPGRNVQWILTVPAIWSAAAKQTMRRAASKVRKL